MARKKIKRIMKGYCPGCSERDLAIRILQDTVGTALSRNPIGMFARGVQDYSHSLIQNPDLRPYQASRRVSELDDRTNSAIPRAKRKVSGYQKEFGRQLKRLKKAHPRTDISRLMKRAHVATRKARK